MVIAPGTGPLGDGRPSGYAGSDPADAGGDGFDLDAATFNVVHRFAHPHHSGDDNAGDYESEQRRWSIGPSERRESR
jgi:hypothetical protein